MNRGWVRERVKWWLFPGMNLHARLRMQILPSYLGVAKPGEERLVLDAGCGNGMLSYASWERGNRVVGISIKANEVAGCRRLFNGYLGIPDDKLSFREWNLYEVEKLGQQFDEIICSEVLEHLVRDAEVCRGFRNSLKRGGVLHLCVPNCEHPDHAAKELDRQEQGGHVRHGYTIDSCRILLEPLGFRIEATRGLGGPIRQGFCRRIIRGEEAIGMAGGVFFFLLSLPFVWIDPKTPVVPYSVYVKAVRNY